MSKPEINCSHISREEAIRQKEISLQDLKANGNFLFKEDFETWSNEAEGSQQTSALKDKITNTIAKIENHLIEKGVIAEESIGYEGVTNKGLKLFKEDLLRRADTEFESQIPDYMRKFISYISLIESFEPDQQKAFLAQFPPDSVDEYQCNDGAKSRLEAVFASAKGSSFVVKAHDIVVEDIATEFRKSVNSGNHPHVAPFVNYLLGVKKSLVSKEDGFYLIPSNQVSNKQSYEAIEGYDEILLRNYLNLIEGNKEKLIKEIIEITQDDNSKSAKSDPETDSIYRSEKVKELLMNSLDIDENLACAIILKISEEQETKKGSNKYTYWLKINQDGEETKSEDIDLTLRESIQGIINKKAEYISEITKSRKSDSLSSEILELENITDLIEASATLEYEDGNILTQKERSAIYALTALSEKYSTDPMHFLVASDHLVGKKDSLLKKDMEGFMTEYIDRIFEVRENYLGSENANAKVDDLHPLFCAILTKNDKLFLETLDQIESEDLKSRFEETFSPRNQLNIRSKNALDFLMQVNNYSLVKIFVEKLSQNPEFFKEFLNNKDFLGRNPLAMAAMQGHTETVKALLDSPTITQNLELFKEFLNNKDLLGRNPLAMAAIKCNAETVKGLLDSSAINQNPELFKEFLNNKDSSGSNALGWAAILGNTEIVKAFLGSSILAQNPELLKELLSNKNNDGDNALNSAVRKGHAELVKAFLDSSAINQNPELFKEFLNNKDFLGRNPLAMAAIQGHTETVKAFLDSLTITQNPELFKEFLNNKDSFGCNALGWAAILGNAEIVKAFLDSPILAQNPELLKELLNNENNDGDNSLNSAVRKGHAEAVKAFLDSSAINQNPELFKEFLNNKDDNGDNLLVWAVKNDHAEIVKSLLGSPVLAKNPELLKEFLNNKNNMSCNALDNAAFNGNTEITKLLLEAANLHEDQGFLKEFVNNKNNMSCNALDNAAFNGNTEMIRLLLGVAIQSEDRGLLKEFLNNKDVVGFNTLCNAAYNGHTEIAKLLLDAAILSEDQGFSKEFLNNRGLFGRNALGLAATKGHTETVKAFLDSPTINQNSELFKEFLNNKDDNGDNLLGWAVKNGQTEITKLLLEAATLSEDQGFLKEFLNNKKYSFGCNALGYAACMGHTETAKAFLDNLALTQNPELFKEFLNNKDNNGDNALTWAVRNNNVEMVKLLLNKGSIIIDPLPYSQASEMCDSSKMTANNIIRCIKSNPESLFSFIQGLSSEDLEQSINVSVYIDPLLNHKHRTPLQFAASLGAVNAMEILIDAGAEVNVVNNKDRTALDYAIKERKSDAINFLRSKGGVTANPSASIKGGNALRARGRGGCVIS